MPNLYDNLQLDIKLLHSRIDKRLNIEVSPCRNMLRGIVNFFILAFIIKIGLYKRLIDAGFLRGWFNLFKKYWEEELGARPISFYDFHFLRCSYRVKFQKVAVEDCSDRKKFSFAWQRYENIYSTFSLVYKDALNPLVAYKYLPYLKIKSKVLEYGCGLASITWSLIRFFPYKKLDYSVADIEGFPFHYAKYRLRNYGIKFYNIKPYEKVNFKNKFDAIFLITVLEHLPNPKEIIVHLTNSLNPNGILFFDYIKSKGEGLDTTEAVKERREVLRFIEKNYTIIKGKIDFHNSMGFTVACKK